MDDERVVPIGNGLYVPRHFAGHFGVGRGYDHIVVNSRRVLYFIVFGVIFYSNFLLMRVVGIEFGSYFTSFPFFIDVLFISFLVGAIIEWLSSSFCLYRKKKLTMDDLILTLFNVILYSVGALILLFSGVIENGSAVFILFLIGVIWIFLYLVYSSIRRSIILIVSERMLSVRLDSIVEELELICAQQAEE